MRSSFRRIAWPLALAAIALAGCSSVAGPEVTREMGVISFYQQPVLIEVPAAVEAGTPFQILVRTYGGGCITRNGTDVESNGFQADVIPYDLNSGAEVCTDELRMFDHTATLAFSSTGTALIRIHGLEQPGNRQIVVERSVRID